MKSAVAYIRVSTEKQGASGIGAEAQTAAIQAYADGAGYEVLAWFEDAASGRGEHNLKHRPGLQAALNVARNKQMPVLVCGLDRLARHSKTVEEIILKEQVRVVSVTEGATDDHLVIASRAARAEAVGDAIARRTKDALSKLKAEGVELGNRRNLAEAGQLGADRNAQRARRKVEELAEIIEKHRWNEMKIPALVEALNGLGCKTSRNEAWTPGALRRPHRLALELIKMKTESIYESLPNFGVF